MMKILGYEFKKAKSVGLPNFDPPKTPNKEQLKVPLENEMDIKKKIYGEPLPGRRSVKDTETYGSELPNIWNYEIPEFVFEVIPLIRKLSITNEDVGQVIFDLIQLCNTGHHINFDKKVKPDEVDKMRRHIYNRSKVWTDGVAGIHGLVNKLFNQILIGGALSMEWVIDSKKTGISNIFLVKPESIRWKWNKSKLRYEPYQFVRNASKPEEQLIKLNQFTYRYYALMGDTEIPYGIPLYIPALQRILEQKGMDKNIDYILDQLGILGFFEAKLAKPDQNENESDKLYQKRLESLLTTTKKNLSESLKDGITVGYIDDHEFEFHSTTKNLAGVNEIYNKTLKQIAKGLKHPPSFLGISEKGSETHINIVFTKMVSQLKNIQYLVKQALEFGYALELRLAGYQFDFLEVDFEESTITDDLKKEQSGEIRRRNLLLDYNQGLISQETFADLLGYEAPDKPEPRVTVDPDDNPNKKKEDREKDKDTSDRRVRDKGKPQPKRKDQDTKPV